MDIVNIQSYYCHYPPRMFFDFPTSRGVRNKVVAATAQSATLRTVKVALYRLSLGRGGVSGHWWSPHLTLSRALELCVVVVAL